MFCNSDFTFGYFTATNEIKSLTSIKPKSSFSNLPFCEKKADYFDYGKRRLDVSNAKSLPKAPLYQTLYISGGKKNKLNKIDIVGFFSQKGKLEKDDLGLIEVKDFISFVAVKYPKVKSLLQNIKDEKMKGKKYKIEVARKVIKKEEE